MPPPDPAGDREAWTGSRPLVTGVPVVIGAIVVGSILIVLLASLGRQPDLVAQLSQQFTAMMAGTLAPGLRITDPARLAEALRTDRLPFTARVPVLAPDFQLLGGRTTTVDDRPTARMDVSIGGCRPGARRSLRSAAGAAGSARRPARGAEARAAAVSQGHADDRLLAG